MNKDFWIELCILGEPTNLSVGIGHKGIVWFMIDFKGKAAHASTPYLGDNAIEKAAKFIKGLEKVKLDLQTRSSQEYGKFTPPTMNIGIIEGGKKTNVVPNRCHLEIDRRLIPGETAESAYNEVLSVGKELFNENEITIKPTKHGKPYQIQDGVKNNYCKEILNITEKYKNNNEIISRILQDFIVNANFIVILK